MSRAPPKMPKGIQFVKSSETLIPGSAKDKGNDGQQSLFSKPPSLLSLPEQSRVNVNNSRDGGSYDSFHRPQFGSPAVNFASNSQGSNPRFGMGTSAKYGQKFIKSGESYSSLKNEQSIGRGYQMPGSTDLSRKDTGFVPPIPKTTTAQPICSNEDYLKAWKGEKDPLLAKIRKLAYEIVTLKSDRPNAMDKLHSAANRVPLRIEFNTEPVMGAKNSRSFICNVFVESVSIASGRGPKIRSSKAEAYEVALQKILMPHMRVVPIDPTSKMLEVSARPFTSPPREPSKFPLQNNSNNACQHKESNLEAAGLKRRHNEYKNLDEFVIVEPKVGIPDCTSAHTLRRSADFNHMLLEYEYFFKGESARCILKIENEILADVNGVSKVAAKNTASAQALTRLKQFCWIIKTKQAVDSDSKISKDEIFSELSEQSDSIANDNIGNQMLRKMGWSGGGVGKDEDGIAEPISLKSVLNREGLGLGTSKGITDDFKRRISEVIENYASSDNQEDLVFSHEFRLEERQIIHDECRRLNLKSKSRGKGQKRYLCVRRKRSVNQLFDHLMSVGGETTRYQLVPPGADTTPSNSQGPTRPGPAIVNNSSHPLLASSVSANGIVGPTSGSSNSVGGFQFGRNAANVGNQFNRADDRSNSFTGGGSRSFGPDYNNSTSTSSTTSTSTGKVSSNWRNTNSNPYDYDRQRMMQGGFRSNSGGGGGGAQQGSVHNPVFHNNRNGSQNNEFGSGRRTEGGGWNNQPSYGNNGQFPQSQGQGQGFGNTGQGQARGYGYNNHGSQGYGANAGAFNPGYGAVNNYNQGPMQGYGNGANGQGMMSSNGGSAAGGGGGGFQSSSSYPSFPQQQNTFGFGGGYNNNNNNQR